LHQISEIVASSIRDSCIKYESAYPLSIRIGIVIQEETTYDTWSQRIYRFRPSI